MNDTVLRDSVIEALDFEPSIDAAHIGVAAHDGVVTLSGTVPSLQQKWTAERIARKVRGVQAIAEEISVVLPFEKKTADEEIARRALNIMRWDTAVPHDKIAVKVENGIITLSGHVDWHYQKQETEILMHRLGGVKAVINLIEVKPAIDAYGVHEKVERALRRDAELDAAGIKIGVDGGTVKLDGTVHSWAERRAAEAAAWAAPGVSRVEDHLLVNAY
jgi:osmotically-inducible protein OsmY